MQRLNCERYPCHFPEQDCTFCFCPFYPCLDERTGGRGDPWSCESCTLLHRQDVAKVIIDRLMENVPLALIWNELERDL
jgi:threonine-phosphate decarboxylase